MKDQHRNRCLINLFILFLILTYLIGQNSIAQNVEVSAITYETEDGWTIRGTLTLPVNPSSLPIPGVVLVTEPVNRLRTTYHSTLETMLPEEDIAGR